MLLRFAAAAEPEEPKEEQTEFAVKLEAFDASKKIAVIKEVRASTSLGLKEVCLRIAIAFVGTTLAHIVIAV